MNKLTGLIAASHTPIDPDGLVMYDQIAKQAQFYSDNNVNGAFVCGTTGEGKLLSLQERMQVAELWIEHAQDRFPVVVHVGDDCLDDCRVLARHAQEKGAFAISTIAPNYYRPKTIDDLVSYCSEIAEAAPALPFYFYNIPMLTHVNFPMLQFLQIAEKRIPNLAGIKYTHDDYADLMECLNFSQGRYSILFGRDEQLLAALIYGVDGAIGSTYNYAAPLYQALIQAVHDGDLVKARELQFISIKIVRIITQYSEIAVGKAIMSWLGVNCGSVRQPLKPLSDLERQTIENELSAEIFAPYLCKFACLLGETQ